MHQQQQQQQQQQDQTNSQNNLTLLKSNYKYKRREMLTMRVLPAADANVTTTEARKRKPNQLAATLSNTQTSAAAAATPATAATTTVCKCSTILSLFIVITWKLLQAMANCLRYAVRIIANNAAAADGDDDDVAAVVYEKCVEQVNAMAAGPDHDVNAANIRTTHAANDEVSTAREQQQQQQQQPAHSSSSSLQKRNRCLTTTSRIMLLPATATGKSGWPALMTLLIALLLSMRLAAAGTCWQTQQSHDKCSNLYSTNITKLECCGASQTFSYTDRELSNVEHFFATAIGGGVECAPCMGALYKLHFTTPQQQQQQQHINPVCGNDGRTYNTECQLRKRACRTNNAQLEVAYRGHCKTSCHGVQCLNGLICVEDQNMMPHCIACQINCPWDDQAVELAEEHAVCGVDGQTYRSICDINRMICQIGRSIAVAYPGPCRADRVTCANIKCGPKDTCLLDLQTQLPRCVSCRYKCARKQQRSPYNVDKICGNNNHTYNSYCEMRKDSCATGYYIGVRSTGVC
ncbi:Fs [Drosophila busckii]|uniref:Fs n=1 Tax=Drosophila busckii TaxID=30019 RepID=A0A0M5J7M3_DROBS|nr:Fs [Drosophila busckii]